MRPTLPLAEDCILQRLSHHRSNTKNILFFKRQAKHGGGGACVRVPVRADVDGVIPSLSPSRSRSLMPALCRSRIHCGTPSCSLSSMAVHPSSFRSRSISSRHLSQGTHPQGRGTPTGEQKAGRRRRAEAQEQSREGPLVGRNELLWAGAREGCYDRAGGGWVRVGGGSWAGKVVGGMGGAGGAGHLARDLFLALAQRGLGLPRSARSTPPSRLRGQARGTARPSAAQRIRAAGLLQGAPA